MAFVHLHVHSEFSLLQSVAKIDDLVEAAAKKQFKAIGLTDIDAMYGVIPFYKACRLHNIKPIIGVELKVSEEPLLPRNRAEERLIFLAENLEGYQTLLKLTSQAQDREEAYEPYLLYEELATLKGVIIISPFQQGKIQNALYNGVQNEAEKMYTYLKSSVGEENVYIEIQNHWRREEREKLLAVRDWALKEQAKVVATNHVHFIKKEQVEAHRIVEAIKVGETLKEQQGQASSEEYYLKDEDEMKHVFSSWPEALEETGKLADRCHVDIPLGESVLPKFPVSDGETAQSLLERLCKKGLKERYVNPSKEIHDRLDYELRVIFNMNYSDYFLIVADFMNYAHRNGILTGPGRGSAAGSLVAYVLKITQVDPIKYGLLFERFLNPERVSMPDIDIDFSDRQRDEVIHYVARKYGTQHVAQIVTFGTLAAKAALRDAGKVLGLEPRKIDKVAKLIRNKPNLRIHQAISETPALKELMEEDDELTFLFKVASDIEGLPRHTSVHAAGIVISQAPLTDVVPLQKGHEGLSLTQYPMGDLESIGLLKMDFLGLRNLSFIEKISQLVKKNSGKELQIPTLPLEDERTFALLGEGDTSGVFQLESSGMKSVLKRLKPSHFEDIVAVNALYRPGPMENIPSYIKRKHGEETVSFPHDDLHTILEPTYGVLIYQEQIMQIASKMAGFSLGQADVLRRAIGKKKRETLEETRKTFIKGAIEQGYVIEEAEKVYNLIVRFADYGFNRSHAVAYSMISYQLAYLKANYPLEFLSGLMDMSLHHQDKLAEYIAEAKRKGINVQRPSINKSEAGFAIYDNFIWIGLAALKNVGIQTVNALLQEREKGMFQDLFDLCARLPQKLLSRRTLESLILSGALDDFSIDRATLLASLDDAIEYGEKEQEKLTQGEDFLFFEEEQKPHYTKVNPLSAKDKLQFEKEVLGFYASGHPIEHEKVILSPYDRLTIHEIRDLSDHHTVRMAGMVEDVRLIQTKKKEKMAFIRLSDESGEMEVTIFPQAYSTSHTKFQREELVFIEGKVQLHNGTKKVVLDKCVTIDELKRKEKERHQSVLYLYITHLHEKQGLDDLKELLQNMPGEVPVVLKYQSTNKAVRLSEMWNVTDNEDFLIRLKSLIGAKNVYLKNPRV
ncbi:DNA polymerase III subunit alpha [Bacillus sp. A301a_S52]|nr:DNA polymerase III subunit alpha [Bacillus sp. A301a_S52]